MADGPGGATVFDAIATKELTVGKGYGNAAAHVDADDLIIDNGPGNAGLTIKGATTGQIYFGDAALGSAGKITYTHATDKFSFAPGGTAAVELTPDRTVHLRETTDNTPALTLSGGLFVSGGALWYLGYGGKYTQIAASA